MANIPGGGGGCGNGGTTYNQREMGFSLVANSLMAQL